MTTEKEVQELKVDSFEFRMEEFVRKRIESLAEETIGFEIRQIASNMGMSSRYVNSIKYRVEGLGKRIKLIIYLDYFGKENGEPLGFWFEHGTKRHWIEPKEASALHWFSGGQHFFSKGHWVDGIKAHKIFEEGKTRGMPELIGRLKAEMDEHQERLFN